MKLLHWLNYIPIKIHNIHSGKKKSLLDLCSLPKTFQHIYQWYQDIFNWYIYSQIWIMHTLPLTKTLLSLSDSILWGKNGRDLVLELESYSL